MRPNSFYVAIASAVLGGLLVTIFHLGEYDQGYSAGYQKGRDAADYIQVGVEQAKAERLKSMGLCWYATHLCKAPVTTRMAAD